MFGEITRGQRGGEGWAGGWKRSPRAGKNKAGPARARPNALQALNLRRGRQEGRGGESAGGARLRPKSIGSLHLPLCLARSLAPPHCSRPCFSRGKREGKKGAGRIWVGGGGWGLGLGLGQGLGQPARRTRCPPGLPRLRHGAPLPQRVCRAGTWGAAAEQRPLHLSAGPGRGPRRRPPSSPGPRLLRVQLRLGRTKLPAAGCAREENAFPGPLPP